MSFTTGNKLGAEICEALGLDPSKEDEMTIQGSDA